MNRYQKIAWFNLIVMALTIGLTTTIIAIEIHSVGYSRLGLFGLVPMALLQFTPLMFKKPESPNGVVSDERDGFIVTRAASFAWITFWWALIVSCLLLWVLIGPENSVPTIVLPLIAFGGALLHKIVSSIAILVQYGKGVENAEA